MTNDEDFPKRCQVLAEFWIKHRDNPELAGFFNYHGIGLPLAFMQEHNLCVATDKGIEHINETFNDLVEIVENEEEHSDQIAEFLGEQFMTKTSRATNTACGNKYCDNKSAKVDEICGKFISSTDENCDYINYLVARPAYSLALEFVWSAPEDLKAEMIELEEVIVDLSEFDSERDLTEYVLDTCGSEYGDLVEGYVSSLLISWRKTFGVQSELNPNFNVDEGPRFGSFELTLDGDDLHISIVIIMKLKSHQNDMLEWYPESLAETLMDEEDLIWSHEGTQITLVNVEVG